MKKKDRYVVEKMPTYCLFPEALCGLKDTEGKFYVVLENIDAVIKIKDLLNQQDKRIKELELHSLNEKEWQDYCSYKIIEPQIKGCLDRENKLTQENQQLKQSQKQLAISALEEVNSILTNIIIEVTEYEMNLDKLCYLEEISYEFGQAIKNKVEGLKK